MPRTRRWLPAHETVREPDGRPDARRWLPAASALGAALLLGACTAVQTGVPADPAAPGFLLGFWHGLIAPIAFVVSLFSETVRIYAVPNAGRWYDFGFMLGIGGFSGGVLAGGKGGGKKGK